MRASIRFVLLASPLTLCLVALTSVSAKEFEGGPPSPGWELAFEEQFDGGDAELDARWDFQNGPSGHILCSRWRDNAVLDNGILRMIARKEDRAGQDWTAASLWTKQEFQYGYYECRYRYAPVAGTNNSFWIMQKPGSASGRFEIDINEGHYPFEVNMNLHQHSGEHWAKGGRWYYYGTEPGVERDDAAFQFVLEEPITTDKIRLVSQDSDIVRIQELRAFAPSSQGYPSVFPNPMEAQPQVTNHAIHAGAEASSSLQADLGPEKAIDGQISTDSRWVSSRDDNAPILTLSFPQPQEIGCIQFISGWLDGDAWRGIVQDFRLEFWDGDAWRPIPGASSSPDVDHMRDPNAPPDLGHSFHVYGLEWNEEELIYYFDGKEIRRMENEICHEPAPVFLSLAIIRWAGLVTDDIHNESMDVDWVRVWERE